MHSDKNYFEIYLEHFPEAPSLVLVRSVELKNFPQFIQAPLLDLCCGDGFFLNALAIREAYGCDIDKSSAYKAHERGNYKVIVGDARNLPYPNSYFKTIISNCALEHVNGICQALNSLNKVLCNEGILIMSVPSNNLNEWYPPKIILQKLHLGKYGENLLKKYNKSQFHVNIYSLYEWKKKLELAGFEIIRHFYLFNENEYKLVILLDDFGISFKGKINMIFNRFIPVKFRIYLWSKILKPIYLNSKPLDFGGELVLVAKKIS